MMVKMLHKFMTVTCVRRLVTPLDTYTTNGTNAHLMCFRHWFAVLGPIKMYSYNRTCAFSFLDRLIAKYLTGRAGEGSVDIDSELPP